MKSSSPTHTQFWTLTALVERVERALARDYKGPSSGQVRAVPDARTLRYYTSIALLDKPLGYRGRQALYGPRHLLQVVAIKRLQAQGLLLEEIQRQLLGISKAKLAAIAAVAAELLDPSVAPGFGTPEQRNETAFWLADGDQRRPIDETEVNALTTLSSTPTGATVAAAKTTPAALQSLALSADVLLVFGGPALDADETLELQNLAQPLLQRLQKRLLSAASTMTLHGYEKKGEPR